MAMSEDTFEADVNAAFDEAFREAWDEWWEQRLREEVAGGGEGVPKGLMADDAEDG